MREINGHEIYEGDILKITSSHGYHETGLIIYKDVTARFGFLSSDGSVYGLSTNDPNNEIIGNIHDNPELIENPQILD